MNILVINKFCPLHPNAGGAEKRLEEIFSRIAQEHTVHLLTSNYPGASKTTHRGIHIHRIGKEQQHHTYIHLALPFVLHTYLKKLNIDVVYEDISVIPFFTPILTRTKKVAIIHQLNTTSLLQGRNKLLGSIGYLAEKFLFVFYRTTPMITVSQWMKDLLEHKGISSTLIRNGVDESLFTKTKHHAKNPTALFLGRLEPRKGPEQLIKTYTEVQTQIPNVQYVFAGQIQDARYHKYVEHYPEIQFLGRVSEETKKKKLLDQAWVLVMPSTKEGYGIVALEAQATQTPVIANDIDGLRESAKTQTLIDCTNTELLTQEILKKLRKPQTTSQAWARKHNWDRAAQDTLKALNE